MKEIYRIGIDEVGRGPVAGPVVVCACAVKKGFDSLELFPSRVLLDSKKLSEKKRDQIRDALILLEHEGTIISGIGEVSAARIDEIGLSAAIKEAMNNALISIEKQGVPIEAEVLLDGSLYAPERYCNQSTHIKGDEKFAEISFASIIAKVYRDMYMKEVSKKFPGYGFEKHVGYGTRGHYEAIRLLGRTPQHRASFLTKMK
jgi:ribonuclease HII